MTARLRLRQLARLAGHLRLAGGVMVVIALVGLAAACGGSSSNSTSASSSAATSTTSRAWSIIALGDSVPSGYNCKCTPYPQLSANGLTYNERSDCDGNDDAVAGYTTADVLKQLNSDSPIFPPPRINVGANDVPYKNSCGTSVACYAPLVAPMQKNLEAIVSRVHGLTSGHKVLVVLLDYWSIWLGCTYARNKGNAYIRAAREMTDQVDAAIKTTATQSGSAYVDERAAFEDLTYRRRLEGGEKPEDCGCRGTRVSRRDELTAKEAIPIAFRSIAESREVNRHSTEILHNTAQGGLTLESGCLPALGTCICSRTRPPPRALRTWPPSTSTVAS